MAGCLNKTQTVTENNIQFDSIQVEKTYHLLDDPKNPHCDLQVKYIYPAQYEKIDILKSVREHFLRSYFGEGYEALTPEEAVKRFSDQYIEDYKAMEEIFEPDNEPKNEEGYEVEPGDWFMHYEDITNEINYSKNNILCFSVSSESYMGGAHGSHIYMSYVLDLSTGGLITEEDLFVDNYQDDLAKLLVRKLAKTNEVEQVKELEEIGYFSIDEINPNNNFYVDETGITYYFNEYEIGPYAMGMVDIHLSFDEIKYLIRPESPIRRLID
jgi:hypothetical protein